MSTNDVSVYNKPCACGCGQIEITATSPDHPWVRSPPDFSYRVLCTNCASQYIIRDRGYYLSFEVEQSMAQSQKLREVVDEIKSTPQFSSFVKYVIQYVDNLPSRAAIFRFLQGRDDTGTQSTFYRNWRGAEDWGKSTIKPLNMNLYFDIFDVDISTFQLASQKLKQLEREIVRPKLIKKVEHYG